MIKSVEIFLVDSEENNNFSMFSSSSKWCEIYNENNFFIHDHLVSVPAHNDIEFFIWDHLGTTDSNKLIHDNRKKTLNVSNGVAFCVNYEGGKFICLLGIQSESFSDYILVQKKHLREFAHTIFFTYCMSSDYELRKYIQKLPSFEKGSERVSCIYTN